MPDVFDADVYGVLILALIIYSELTICGVGLLLESREISFHAEIEEQRKRCDVFGGFQL